MTATAEAPDVAVVLVHYHTPTLAAEAIAALRADDRHRLRIECVIIDNGSDAAGAETLRNLGGSVLTAGRNLGYAGGVNLGVASTRAPIVVVMNADVLVRPGCLAALGGELLTGGGAGAVAGPRLSWDLGGRILLPPTERRDFVSDALARISTRGDGWGAAARRRWRRHARRHWDARESIDSYALSGALLAFRRDVWDAVGPFDEGYRLYFEETDWLARLAARGWRGRYVPAAQAVHHYNRSARDEPEAPAWFAESARRFEQKHMSPLRVRWLRRLEAADTRGAGVGVTSDAHGVGVGVTLDLAHHVDAGARWVEISSQPAGYPAAAERLILEANANAKADDATRAHEWRLPADIWNHLAAGGYTLRVVDDDGREHGVATFQR